MIYKASLMCPAIKKCKVMKLQLADGQIKSVQVLCQNAWPREQREETRRQMDSSWGPWNIYLIYIWSLITCFDLNSLAFNQKYRNLIGYAWYIRLNLLNNLRIFAKGCCLTFQELACEHRHISRRIEATSSASALAGYTCVSCPVDYWFTYLFDNVTWVHQQG